MGEYLPAEHYDTALDRVGLPLHAHGMWLFTLHIPGVSLLMLTSQAGLKT